MNLLKNKLNLTFKNMNVITGLNNSGKSYLLKELQRNLNLPYKIFTFDNNNLSNEKLWLNIELNLLKKNKSKYYDRFISYMKIIFDENIVNCSISNHEFNNLSKNTIKFIKLCLILLNGNKDQILFFDDDVLEGIDVNKLNYLYEFMFLFSHDNQIFIATTNITYLNFISYENETPFDNVSMIYCYHENGKYEYINIENQLESWLKIEDVGNLWHQGTFENCVFDIKHSNKVIN